MKLAKLFNLIFVFFFLNISFASQNLFDIVKNKNLTQKEKISQMRPLIKGETNVNVKDENGRTLVYHAIYGDNPKVLQFLIGKKADITSKDQHDNTPLDWASRQKNPELAKILIENGGADLIKLKGLYIGAAMNYKSPGVKGLHVEAIINHVVIQEDNRLATRAINEWFHPNEKDYFKQSVLHWAIFIFNSETYLIKPLIDKGADVNARAIFKQTPLHLSAIQENLNITQLLIDKGAKLNAKDGNGNTPLHWAIKGKNSKAAQLLIDKGAGVNIQDKNGKTAIILAAEKGLTDIVLSLKNHPRISLRLTDKDGRDFREVFEKTHPLEYQKFLIAERRASLDIKGGSRIKNQIKGFNKR